MSALGEAVESAAAVMARLRAPGGCPWDRAQTFASIKPYTLEEVYEVARALGEGDGDPDWDSLRDELGDLLLQILFYAEMAAEKGKFDLLAVVRGLEAKLIRRHPHVFGPAAGAESLTPDGVVARWEEIKQRERAEREPAGTPAGMPAGMPAPPRESKLGPEEPGFPALVEAYRLSVRAARAGFEWPSAEAVLDKMEEEIAELRAELRRSPAPARRVAAEAGDLLFTAVNVARRSGVEPETALKAANRKFRRRFAAVEAAAEAAGENLARLSAEDLDHRWRAAKRAEPEL